MTYRPLGESGLMVSAVGIGCNAFSRRVDQDGVADILAAARDTGVTLLDTADVYGVTLGASEEMLGIALEGQRDEFVVATKFGGGRQPDGRARASRSTIVAAVEGSLRRLRTDHIDLYQLHVPDDVTPIEETLSALTDLVRAGKVRYVGSSNFAAWQIADADWTARAAGLERFVSAQNGYSLLDRAVEDEVVPACEAYGHRAAAVLPARVRPADRQVPARRGGASGLPGRARPRALAVAAGRRVGPHRGADVVRRGARPHAARRGDRGPGGPAGRRVGDLGRHARRAGAGERRGAAVAAHGRGPRRARRADRLTGQATWSERFERPIQKPSMTCSPGSSGSVAAPRVTNSGV